MRKTTEMNKMVEESLDSLDELGCRCLCMALARSVDRLSRNKTHKQVAYETTTIAHRIATYQQTGEGRNASRDPLYPWHTLTGSGAADPKRKSMI